MSTNRFVGLSKEQSVPRLLSVIGKPTACESMRDVEVDAPPLSSSDDDTEGPSRRGDIQPSRFLKAGQKAGQKWSNPNRDRDGLGRKTPTAAASREERTRTSTRTVSTKEPASNPNPAKETGRHPEVTDPGSTPTPPFTKKLKRSRPGDGELGSQFVDNIFSRPVKKATVRYGSKTKTFGRGNVRRDTSPASNFIPPPRDSMPEAASLKRKKFKMPSSPSRPGEDAVAPTRIFNAVPDSGRGPRANVSPVRRKTLKMPKEESLVVSEESQRPVFKMPDELPDSFIVGEQEGLDFALSPTANPSPPAAVPRRSTSPLTDSSPLIATPVCPLCKTEVDGDLLADFKAKHARMTVAQMRRFCQQHKKTSAQQAWLDRGYPDIDWRGLDGRIAEHYGFLTAILEGDARSHYGDAFRDAVRAGQNRTLFRSDANLTPGYYGIRGLRAMSENLIGEFSALLRRRALQDRLVSARGHTAYLQSVLVPELAVRLIVEDMGVGEEEARRVLTESSWVGEMVNDEIADVVLDDEDEAGNYKIAWQGSGL
ncbi:hypothetical protein BT67DRAFT_460790 [Trichocladium antarcticum]|uniref:Restriction of telomere capping protein 4 n=1 Tax=Trichocladium antarcticum TaxID=1450529 RepID=A0AAN6UQ01_9PEZI|nr:hypothetical protein BT67DRAFT_460790 [Trichocladium antarcticum]